MVKLDETCRNSSENIFEHIKSNFSGLRNHPVLQDSRVRLRGHGESWWTFSGQNLMKLAEIVQNTFLNILKAILLVSGTILSSTTPGSDFKDMESWWTFSGQNLMKPAEIVQNTFLNILKAILVVSGIILSSKTPGSDIKDMESLDGLFHGKIWWNFQKQFKMHFWTYLKLFF